MGNDSDDDVDDQGKIEGLIDYDCNEDFNRDELYTELSRLSKGRVTLDDLTKKKAKGKGKKKNVIMIEELSMMSPKKNKKHKPKLIITKSSSNPDIGSIFMSYILAKANETIKKKPKKRKVVINDVTDVTDVTDVMSDEDLDLDIMTDKSTTTDESFHTDDLDDEELDDEELDDEELDDEEDEEDEEGSDYDEFDDEYIDVMDKYDNDNSADSNLDYFHSLQEGFKKGYIKQIKEIYELNSTHIPLRFKVLNSDMDVYTKSLAIQNLDKLSEMDISTGEYNKMDQWINGLIKLPFGKVTELPVKDADPFEKKREYIQETLLNMDKAIYGHKDAKGHVLQVIGKWIRNPASMGNVLAIQGPMGNGKTTLIKNGIAKSLNRPFEFVALGGASDSAFFEGHAYTYEGSRWGRIVDILHKCGSMNPIICFDELDKVSDTPKGEEIINMLIHMTDSTQNMKFQDHYYPGIDIDLSKVLFIFSFNDESKINRILKDRMYVIRTKGFETKDKLQIAHNYLLPDIYQLFNYTKDDITFTDEILTEIISKYTGNEEGVRNFKRCLESIVSTLNIYHLTKSDDKDDIIDMKIKDFKLPIILTDDHITSLLKVDSSGKSPEHMYM
jgi:ATP-dependent Lon protease